MALTFSVYLSFLCAVSLSFSVYLSFLCAVSVSICTAFCLLMGKLIEMEGEDIYLFKALLHMQVSKSEYINPLSLN